MSLVQGECAQACYAENTCLACSEPLPAESFHPLSSGKHLKATARMLGLYNPDTIMAAASSGMFASVSCCPVFTYVQVSVAVCMQHCRC